MVLGREPCSDISWDDKEAQCRAAVPMDQDHESRPLQKRQSKDLKRAIYLMKWIEGRMRKNFRRLAMNLGV
jgi:hypothetical protein